MKAILMSIQPKWCELIASGKKRIEVRKTRPKIETPFKCYIYETKAQFIKSVKGACTSYGYGRGKVIGEFVCDEMIEDKRGENTDVFSKFALLSLDEQKKYGKNKPLYGWHISELKIYDEPKELSEFKKLCPTKNRNCVGCEFYSRYEGTCANWLTRPPQSWCYVEEIGQ